MTITGEGFCYQCMPDEFTWLLPVDEKPDPFFMDRNHAYITPDNTVYVLDHTRTKVIPLGGGGGLGVVDLSDYALKSDLENKIKGLLEEIAEAKAKTFKAGANIEITEDNTINNTYDDKNIQDRLSALENKDIPVYLAGQGITIRPDNTIDAEVTLNKVNEVVTKAVADTEINLNSANLVIEGNNLVWKGTLNTGRQINSSVPLSSLGVNHSAIDELKQRLTAVEGKADRDTTYTAGNGIILAGTTFSADTKVLATKASVDALANRLATQESRPDNDTKYTAGNGIAISNNTISIDTSGKRYDISDEGSLGKVFTPSGAYNFRIVGPPVTSDGYYLPVFNKSVNGDELYLDFSILKSYIDKGNDNLRKYIDNKVGFTLNQYVQNNYYPTSTQGTTHVFTLNSSPKNSKLINSYLILTIPSLEGKGTEMLNGKPVQRTLTLSTPIKFFIPIYDYRNPNYFHKTVRIEALDIELELSGSAKIAYVNLELSNVKLCIVTGKLHNKVEYKYEDFINTFVNFSRTLDGFTYEFRFTNVTSIDLWGLNIAK